MGARRKGRELAVQALYRMELTGDESASGSTGLWEHFESTAEARGFASSLVNGVVAERGEIDALLEQVLENWSVARLSRVDLNVLRVGAYELRHPGDVPTAVVLDEAIEVARRFGGEEAAQFVNGVLDRVADRLGVRDLLRPAVKGASSIVRGLVALLLTSTVTMSGCGYGFAGTGSRLPAEVRTVSLGPIRNATREIGLEKQFLEAIEDEVSLRGRLEVVEGDGADAVFTGALVHYETRPVAFNSRDEALQYQAVLTVDLELRRRADAKLLWQSRNYRAVEDYSAVPGVVVTSSSRFQKQTLNPGDLRLFTDVQLSEGQRRDATERLLENLARETYNQMMEDF